MKKIFAVTFLIFLLTLPAFALSDGAYTRMKKNDPDFARADRNLSKVWGELRKALSLSKKEDFSQLQNDQREWVKNGRDAAADTYMENGYTRTEAYTMATNDRVNFLADYAPSSSQSEADNELEPQTSGRNADKPEADDENDNDENDDEDFMAGEYRNDNGFLFVKIIDAGTMEVLVTFSRYKDEISWSARGWVDDNILELSDDKFIRCQATLTFKGKTVNVEVTETPDWAKATAEDFKISGIYTHI